MNVKRDFALKWANVGKNWLKLLYKYATSGQQNARIFLFGLTLSLN